MAKKILLADDSLTIQKVVELTFSDSDYELVCVSNGQRALERVEEQRPDLILADVVMPEKNGYEVCEAIKSSPATSRIPVVLLSGTFEPFDRDRAERIGADAIVSKPFDSQQLLAQVEALLEPTSGERAGSMMSAARGSAPQEVSFGLSAEKGPFDTGFSAEDFTASLRRPPRREGADPFEEEYGGGDVDSAIEAFEKSDQVFGLGPEKPAELAEDPQDRLPEDASGEPLIPWLREEPERSFSALGPSAYDREETGELEMASEGAARSEADFDELSGPHRSDAPAVELSQPTARSFRAADSGMEAAVGRSQAEEISADTGKVFFDASSPSQAPAFEPREPASAEASGAARAASPEPATATPEVPGEIEMLAKRSSIPELTQMLSSVAKNGNELTEEQIERLATRLVEKLSDRVLREIAWEVIPDMAEIVIKKRIKELESGIE